MSRPAGNVSFRESLCLETRPARCGLVIFGASGDLTRRKLLPALFGLYSRDLLPKSFFLLGTARSAMSEDEFRATCFQNTKRVGLSIRNIRPIRGRTRTAGLVPHSENFPKISKSFPAENCSTVY